MNTIRGKLAEGTAGGWRPTCDVDHIGTEGTDDFSHLSGQYFLVVLPWEMVDKSLSPLQTSFSLFFVIG